MKRGTRFGGARARAGAKPGARETREATESSATSGAEASAGRFAGWGRSALADGALETPGCSQQSGRISACRTGSRLACAQQHSVLTAPIVRHRCQTVPSVVAGAISASVSKIDRIRAGMAKEKVQPKAVTVTEGRKIRGHYGDLPIDSGKPSTRGRGGRLQY
jgi:hypothetical protein